VRSWGLARKSWWGKRSKIVRQARPGQGGTCLIGMLLIHDGVDDVWQSTTMHSNPHAKFVRPPGIPREALASVCW
jgi:hypothetical protein